MGKNNSVIQIGLFCSSVSLFLLITSSAYSQSIDSDLDSAVTRNIFLEKQLHDVSAHKLEHGKSDPALIGMFVHLAETQSLIGEYENAIDSLKEALQVSRINNGLYHYSQIEILDELIVNEALMKNWGAVNSFYDLEEHLFRRLFEPTDARLEVGLEKITAWHIGAVNEDIDNNTQEHLTKVQELLTIRLDVVENLLGNDNARYDYLLSNLAYVEFELQKLRLKRIPASSPAPVYTTKIE
jgi:hypothetical protein